MGKPHRISTRRWPLHLPLGVRIDKAPYDVDERWDYERGVIYAFVREELVERRPMTAEECALEHQGFPGSEGDPPYGFVHMPGPVPEHYAHWSQLAAQGAFSRVMRHVRIWAGAGDGELIAHLLDAQEHVRWKTIVRIADAEKVRELGSAVGDWLAEKPVLQTLPPSMPVGPPTGPMLGVGTSIGQVREALRKAPQWARPLLDALPDPAPSGDATLPSPPASRKKTTLKPRSRESPAAKLEQELDDEERTLERRLERLELKEERFAIEERLEALKALRRSRPKK